MYIKRIIYTSEVITFLFDDIFYSFVKYSVYMNFQSALVEKLSERETSFPLFLE